jgi:hypothetical protein
VFRRSLKAPIPRVSSIVSHVLRRGLRPRRGGASLRSAGTTSRRSFMGRPGRGLSAPLALRAHPPKVFGNREDGQSIAWMCCRGLSPYGPGSSSVAASAVGALAYFSVSGNLGGRWPACWPARGQRPLRPWCQGLSPRSETGTPRPKGAARRDGEAGANPVSRRESGFSHRRGRRRSPSSRRPPRSRNTEGNPSE